jgi:hypothetical protein
MILPSPDLPLGALRPTYSYNPFSPVSDSGLSPVSQMTSSSFSASLPQLDNPDRRIEIRRRIAELNQMIEESEGHVQALTEENMRLAEMSVPPAYQQDLASSVSATSSSGGVVQLNHPTLPSGQVTTSSHSSPPPPPEKSAVSPFSDYDVGSPNWSTSAIGHDSKTSLPTTWTVSNH